VNSQLSWPFHLAGQLLAYTIANIVKISESSQYFVGVTKFIA